MTSASTKAAKPVAKPATKRAAKPQAKSVRSKPVQAKTSPATTPQHAAAHMRVLKPTSLREQIYDHLRERIHSGLLTFDDRLVDVDIANKFGVSRMPVREALMQLVHDGMLESTTRGFVLRRYSDKEIGEIFEIRSLLEPAAATIAAKNMTDAALEAMDHAIADGIKASKANDFTAFVIANATFRRAWLAQVPNTQLVAALARYIDHVQIIRLVTLTHRTVRDDVMDRLRLIHDAFRAGKADRVSALFKQHVDAAVLAYSTYRNH
jgi:DNA-binding GntR family transcriptional regulator